MKTIALLVAVLGGCIFNGNFHVPKDIQGDVAVVVFNDTDINFQEIDLAPQGQLRLNEFGVDPAHSIGTLWNHHSGPAKLAAGTYQIAGLTGRASTDQPLFIARDSTVTINGATEIHIGGKSTAPAKPGYALINVAVTQSACHDVYNNRGERLNDECN